MSVLSQDGDRTKLETFTVGRLDGILWFSGLSLTLLRALPWGGLTPRIGGSHFV